MKVYPEKTEFKIIECCVIRLKFSDKKGCGDFMEWLIENEIYSCFSGGYSGNGEFQGGFDLENTKKIKDHLKEKGWKENRLIRI